MNRKRLVHNSIDNNDNNDSLDTIDTIIKFRFKVARHCIMSSFACVNDGIFLKIAVIIAIGILTLCTVDVAFAGSPQVYLLQNSGWMEPFFTDKDSGLRPLFAALIQSTSSKDQDIVIAGFNQSGAIAGESSPKVVYKGKAVPEEVKKAVDSIGLPRRPDGKLADADFEGALNATLLEILNRQPAIIWMITNNKNDPDSSPDNSPGVVAHTKNFYRLLHDHPGIKRVVAFPVTMPVRGLRYREGGLMIYALSFGWTTDKLLERITTSEGIKHLFTKPPVMIKPLAEQPVAFEPAAVLTYGVKATIVKDNGNSTIIFTGLESFKNGGIISVRGSLKSNYYPQEIKSAQLSMDWANFGKSKEPGLPIKITPELVSDLPPGGGIDNVRIDIQIPPLPSFWSADGLLSNGYELSGVLRITLNNLKLSLSSDFERQMNSIFGLGQLPEIFYPDKNITTAKTLLPVRMVVVYPVWPLAVALAAVILIIILSIAGIILLNHEKCYKVEVDGRLVNVFAKPLKTIAVYSSNGEKVADLRVSFTGKPRITPVNDGVNIRLR